MEMCNITDLQSDAHLWPAYNIVFPAVLALGIIGNVLTLIVLTRPELKGVTYVYLTGLAVSDFAVMLLAIPAVLRYNRHHSIPYSAAFYHSHIELVLTNTYMAASVFIVCSMTVDRYFSVCRPTDFKSIHTKRNAIVSITISYFLGFLISCPLGAMKRPCLMTTGRNLTKMYSYQENRKVTQTSAWMVYLWVCEPATRIVPAITLATLNCLIIKSFRKLAERQRRVRDRLNNFRGRLDTTDRQRVVKYRLYLEEQRLIHLLTAIIITFFVTMTPAMVLSLVYSDHLDGHFGFQIFRAVANILEICNFALNFFIYCLCSKQFRQVFMSLFSDNKGKKTDEVVLDSFKIGTSCSR